MSSNKIALITRVDAQTPSPSDRAKRVLEILRADPNVDTWDVLCFCAEYLGMMSSAWPWLELPAKNLTHLIYTAHYEHFGAEGIQTESKKISETL